MARWSKKWARLPFLTALLLAVAGGGATAQEPLESLDSLVESLFVLGENYEAGDWVRQSDLLAYMWYLLAATAGHEPADAARHRLSRRLTAAERAAAQALARQCHNTGYRECGEATQAEDLASLSEGEDDGQP
jgi:TPR repeat protein